MGKICSHRLLCTSRLHTLSCYELALDRLYKGEAGNPRILSPARIWVDSSLFFQINDGVCKVPDSMPWSFSLPSSLVSTLWGLPLSWWFLSLYLQLELKQPSASGCLSLTCGVTSTSNMCKIITLFVITLLLGFWGTGCWTLGVTFYIHSSLTFHSFRIRAQSDAPGGIWLLSC